MEYYGLSNPFKINDSKSLCSQLINNYKLICDDFFDKDKRPKLKGVFIYINNKNIFGINERYLHSISIKDKEYEMYPCINDESYIYCKSKCKVDTNPNCIFNLNRVFCYYRLTRIFWISEIINLANNDDENIKIWTSNHVDKTNGKKRAKRYVWYKNGLANFVIIFEEKYKNGKLHLLDFRTAYPVVLKRTESQFENQYNKYISEK